MSLRRVMLVLGVIGALVGSVALHQPAAAEGAIIQPSYAGGCAEPPAGAVCLEFVDGYIWLVEDTITGSGMNHGTVQIFYGLNADYAHALNTDMVWRLPK